MKTRILADFQTCISVPLDEESIIDVLLCSSDRFNDSKNEQILLHTICYIQYTKSFEIPLIDQC